MTHPKQKHPNDYQKRVERAEKDLEPSQVVGVDKDKPFRMSFSWDQHLACKAQQKTDTLLGVPKKDTVYIHIYTYIIYIFCMYTY